MRQINHNNDQIVLLIGPFQFHIAVSQTYPFPAIGLQYENTLRILMVKGQSALFVANF